MLELLSPAGSMEALRAAVQNGADAVYLGYDAFNARMEEDVRTAETYQRENERLRTLLKLTEEHDDYVLVSAYITSWNSSEYKSAFTIGKGRNSGLTEGMCAVTENGQVVGLVTEVGANWATFTTIMTENIAH